ncbi:hypothetical protein ACFVFS_06240 [Kitasatospora sp. NPDC057692]|uniref:hypothetical protein n=1 Tax=Kitasatospora sp. NPDC057692 TaxID=3346215 RepID=UPI0036A87ABD
MTPPAWPWRRRPAARDGRDGGPLDDSGDHGGDGVGSGLHGTADAEEAVRGFLGR